MERLLQANKRRRSFFNGNNDQFSLRASIKSIIYQLKSGRQNTANISPFEAHFGRKPNTPLNNKFTVPDSKKNY